jgi:hypothetical protein
MKVPLVGRQRGMMRTSTLDGRLIPRASRLRPSIPPTPKENVLGRRARLRWRSPPTSALGWSRHPKRGRLPCLSRAATTPLRAVSTATCKFIKLASFFRVQQCRMLGNCRSPLHDISHGSSRAVGGEGSQRCSRSTEPLSLIRGAWIRGVRWSCRPRPRWPFHPPLDRLRSKSRWRWLLLRLKRSLSLRL